MTRLQLIALRERKLRVHDLVFAAFITFVAAVGATVLGGAFDGRPPPIALKP